MTDNTQRQIVAIPEDQFDPTIHELPILVGDGYHGQLMTLYQHQGQVYAEALRSFDQIPDGILMQTVEDRALVCVKGEILGNVDNLTPHLSVDKILAVLK